MNKTILITLDSLYDTRLRLLEHMVGEVNEEEYVNRLGDTFKYLGDTYTGLYNRRDDNLLDFKYITPIMHLVKLLIIDLKRDILEDNGSGNIIIDIISDVYTLEEEELRYVEHYVGKYIKGEYIVRAMNGRVTLNDYKSYDIIIDYSGLDRINNWFMSNKINYGSLLDLFLVVPNLIADGKALKNITEEKLLDSIAKIVGSIVNLNFVDKKMFSIRLSKKE